MHPSRWPSRSHADAGGAGSRGSRVRIAAWVLGLSLGLMVRADAPLAEGPKSADAERSLLHLADPSLEIDWVAAEPQVVSPVAMAWDARGFLFVAEMRDYPNAGDGGTIRRLEDRDGDGRHETATVYAQGLPFPNSVLPHRDGVLVTAAPDLLFLRDTDGDGRADVTEVLFSGFGTGNQQLRANGLRWGLDGWVYGANGRSDGAIVSRRRPGDPVQSLKGRDFRFRPDTGEFETLAGRSQFGLAGDDWGHRFLSWNTIPLRHEVIPDAFLARSVASAAVDPLAELLPAGDRGEVFPKTPAPRVFNNESGRHFNALSGLHVFNGDALGEAYRGDAFVGESLLNLVHRRALVPDGATFRAERRESGSEFLAGSDPWFHPVQLATGPDGALYVADFYRRFVEHPDWVAKDSRGRVDWSEGAAHGRVWRIGREGQRRAPQHRPFRADASVASLVASLDTANGWRRDTARRLLWERGDAAALGPLRSAVQRWNRPESRVAALSTWAVLGGEDPRWLARLLDDPNARIRATAARLAGEWLSRKPRQDTDAAGARALISALADRAGEPDVPAALRVALALGSIESESLREPALRRMAERQEDRWVRLAIASGSRSTEFAASLLPPPVSPGPLRPVPRPAPRTGDVPGRRSAVLEAYRPALTLTGRPARGAEIVSRLCLACHSLQGQGRRVGPDLIGASGRSPETLLQDILDPNAQVAPDHAAYEILPKTGDPVVGLIASETTQRLTLRHPGGPDASWARSEIREIRATGRSLMPEGLEEGLQPQDLADLIAFLRMPSAEPLPRVP